MEKKILPARLREKKLPSGNIYYYYDTCQKPRKWLSLGADFYEALKKYEILEQEYNEKELSAQVNEVLTFQYVAKRYMREVLPKKRASTQKDNLRELKKLLEFFNNPPAPINAIRPVHIREYFDWRNQTAKIRANREIALFSHIFNKAREWGYTDNENPVRGVKKNHAVGFRALAKFVQSHRQTCLLMLHAIFAPLCLAQPTTHRHKNRIRAM